MSASSDPIDEMIAQTPDWRGAKLAELRSIIHAADPEISEAVKWRMPSNPLGAPVFERSGIVCVGNILKGRVRLTFSAGAQLPDPHKLFNTRLDSRTVRAIDFYQDEKIDTAALIAIIRAGVAHNLARVKPGKSGKK